VFLSIFRADDAELNNSDPKRTRLLPVIWLTVSLFPVSLFPAPKGSAHETEKIVRLGLPRIPSTKKNAPELDYSSFLCHDWHGNTGCLVAQDLALLTKVRTLIHEEISLLTVLYFPFRARTPNAGTTQANESVTIACG
jgi:hypothetical protein